MGEKPDWVVVVVVVTKTCAREGESVQQLRASKARRSRTVLNDVEVSASTVVVDVVCSVVVMVSWADVRGTTYDVELFPTTHRLLLGSSRGRGHASIGQDRCSLRPFISISIGPASRLRDKYLREG